MRSNSLILTKKVYWNRIADCACMTLHCSHRILMWSKTGAFESPAYMMFSTQHMLHYMHYSDMYLYVCFCLFVCL